MYVSVGSFSNVTDIDTDTREQRRADVLEFNPDGSGMRIYASGIRNCVGEAIQPETGDLWCSVNERDDLGDNLPPDYITHVQDGGFYGWPWYYTGGHPDPRFPGKHPELRTKSSFPTCCCSRTTPRSKCSFTKADQFPTEYHGDIFAAEHGSWNRGLRTGYEVDSRPGERRQSDRRVRGFPDRFRDPQDRSVWGRPVGVAVMKDGSLLVSDDGSNSVWRVSYVGAPEARRNQHPSRNPQRGDSRPQI